MNTYKNYIDLNCYGENDSIKNKEASSTFEFVDLGLPSGTL